MSSPLKSNIIAGIWGFSEAVFFFIVPEVWLSYVGRNNLRTGLIACAFALLGALIGGVSMYSYGASNPDTVNELLTRVPGISQTQISLVQEDMSRGPHRAMMLGPTAGDPYKIYASNFHRYHGSVATFLLASIPARLIRFVGVTVMIHFIFGILRRKFAERTCMAVFAAGWLAFYVFYFSVKGW